MVRQISGMLTITIKKQDENYTIEANGSKGIKVDPQLAPQLKALLSDQQITDTLKDLSSQTAPATTDAIQKLGKALYDSLFTDRDLLLAFGKVQGSASSDSGVRLRLQIEPIELAVLPWETLHDGKDWLSAQVTTPLVRKLALAENRKPLQKLQISGALRVLFVGASPEGKGLTILEIEKTANELEALLAAPIKKKQIVFDKLLNATPQELQQGLLKDYHILYFAGHGSPAEDDRPAGIFLDDGQGDDIEKEGKVIGRERGEPSLVSAETLAQALKGKQTRLVFLAACETSKASEGSRLLRGFAQELAERSNLPAIMAMQYFISDMQANPLTTQFFAALAAGRPVDVAMAEARSVLMKKGQVSRDVFSPVLYLQAEDGALFPKAKNWPAISLGVALLIVAILGGVFYRNSEIKTADSLGRDSQSLFSRGKDIDALVQAIKAGKILQKQHANDSEVMKALQEAIYEGKERNRLEGHVSPVRSVSFSPDGKTLASGSDDKTIKLWNVETGEALHTIKGHKDPITSVSFSPTDDNILATGSDDGTIKLWNLETNQPIYTFDGHYRQTNKVSFSPDGKTLATYGYYDNIQLWNVETGQKILTLVSNKRPIRSISFSLDGKTLATGSDDGTIELWNLQTGEKTRTLYAHKSTVWSISFSPTDDKILATGSDDNTVKLWNVETGKALHTLKGHKSTITSISFAPDGKTLATGSLDNTTKLWDLKSDQEIGTLYGHDGPVDSVSFSPDGKTLATGSRDKTIKLWNVESKPEIRFLKGHKAGINSISFSPDGKALATGSIDKTIKLWNVETGQPVHTLQGHEIVISVSFSPDGKTLKTFTGGGVSPGKLWNVETGKEFYSLNGFISASFSPDGKALAIYNIDNYGYHTIKLWNAKTGQLIRNLLHSANPNDTISSISFRPDSKTLVAYSDPYGYEGKIKLLNVETGEVTHTLKGYKWWENSDSFSPDGKTLAIDNIDKTIDLWNLETGHKINTLQGVVSTQNGRSHSFFSPNSKTLATFSDDGNTIKLWDVETGQFIHSLQGHKGLINGVSFSPNSKILATGSDDNTIKLWDVETGQTIRTMQGHRGAINNVSFSPDGKTLATSIRFDSAIELWAVDLDLDSLTARSCDWIRNYLTYNPNVSESNRHLCDGIGSRK